MAKKKLKEKDIQTIPFRGGMNTRLQRVQIPSGGYSAVQNMRGKHPGLEKRKGMRTKHTTADSGGTKGQSLYQYVKGERTERHFYKQASDGDILDATDAPPTVTTGAFGAEVFSGSASQKSASWSTLKELCLHSNGVDQHQVCAGTANYVKAFIEYDGSATPATIPQLGTDNTQVVTDGSTATYATLTTLATIAAYECLYICTPVPANRLTFTFVSGQVNNNAATGTLKYRKSDNSWYDTAESDGTEVLTLDVAPATAWAVGATITGASSGKTCVIVAALTSLTYQIRARSGAFTLGEILSDGTYTADQGAAHPTVATMGYTGSMTWSQPTDEIPHYMYGISGFWYQWETSATLDTIQISSLTYGTDGTASKHFESIVNVWDGNPIYAIEARFQADTGTAFYTYAGDTVQINSLTANGKVYFNSWQPIQGFYADPGETPNTTATTTIDALYTWTGAGFTSMGTVTDGTSGMSKAGWITVGRPTTAAEQCQFDTSQYYSYWYYFEVDKTISANVTISIETMPFYDINEIGRVGYINAAWKGRAVYNVGNQYGYVSVKDSPMVLNGDDYGILEAGDGRSNRWTYAGPFHSELIVHQEEKGKEGGCTTIFEGDKPGKYGKYLLSTDLGCVNAKSAVTVNGVLTSTQTDEAIKTLHFWISRTGLCVTDGRTCSIFSDDIQNYFDPNETSTCIRKGYEDEHFMGYDSRYNGLVIGLCTGTSAMVANTFFFFDLTDKCFYKDVRGQNISCFTEVEAASGNLPVLQYGCGTDDGGVYELNYGTDDVDIGTTTTAIDAFATMEINGNGLWLKLRKLLLRCKVQTAGDIIITPYRNTRTGSDTITLSMLAKTTNDTSRRHKVGTGIQSDHISLKIQNATAAQSIYLEDMGMDLRIVKGH